MARNGGVTSAIAPSALVADGIGPPPIAMQELRERPLQLRGSRWARRALRMAGWQVDFDGLPGPQGVLIVYPHTSNWDFIVGLLAKWAMGLSVTFWGKESLFRVPLFGRWLRWLGGVPVDRRGARGAVGDMVSRMRQAQGDGRFLWLALAPEGTRAWTPHWRSGFYQVARGADVPLALVHLDYGRRRVGVHSFVRLGGDVAADMAEIERRLGASRGLRSTQAAPIRLH